MSRVISDISISLDGYITGPNDSPELPLGEGGRVLFDWISPQVMEELMAGMAASTGALLMGRRSFENARGWGDEPPFHVPAFVLTHHPQGTLSKRGGTTFTFVTNGLESALEQARAAAGEKNVGLHGGSAVRQCLRAGLLDELSLHVVPVLLGAGNRLFEEGEFNRVDLEPISSVQAPRVTHLRYRVLR